MVREQKCPLEDEECRVFAMWLKIMKVPFAHIANESRSHGRNAVIRGAKLKVMGQSRGYWDYDVFVPKGDGFKLIKIEMKRQKGGTVSPEQKEWGKVYEKAGIPCKICRGAEEAMDFVKEIWYN